jgi:hypothetical protein
MRDASLLLVIVSSICSKHMFLIVGINKRCEGKDMDGHSLTTIPIAFFSYTKNAKLISCGAKKNRHEVCVFASV